MTQKEVPYIFRNRKRNWIERLHRNGSMFIFIDYDLNSACFLNQAQNSVVHFSEEKSTLKIITNFSQKFPNNLIY